MRAADEREYAEFFAATWARLFRSTYAVAGDYQLAEDALQSAFAKAYASWPRVRAAANPAASAPLPGTDSPIDESWSFVEGPVDAQLSFAGGHLLNWSTRLRPTTEQGRPIQLEVGRNGLVFVTFDTDGSVLVAVAGNRGAAMHDCVLPAGTCTSLGSLPTRSGDPVFVGNDM